MGVTCVLAGVSHRSSYYVSYEYERMSLLLYIYKEKRERFYSLERSRGIIPKSAVCVVVIVYYNKNHTPPHHTSLSSSSSHTSSTHTDKHSFIYSFIHTFWTLLCQAKRRNCCHPSFLQLHLLRMSCFPIWRYYSLYLLRQWYRPTYASSTDETEVLREKRVYRDSERK